jgi:glutaredoxin
VANEVLIYGKEGCPYTAAAIRDHQRRGVAHRYIDVLKDPAELQRMVELSGGRRVPVIVEQGRVTVGFHGT